MPLRSANLQAVFARRRETEHNRIERTEAANKYFDHWGKVTARFENWSTPEYYRKAEEQLENSKQQKEKQKKLAERKEKLAKLLEMEKENYEQELQEQERSKNPRRNLDTKTLEKINENLKEQQEMRRKLELEAKLYGKWRHGVDDDNLVFESKSDNEVLAKLNWLDKKVHQQMQHEKDEEAAKERQLKLYQEFNKSEELQKERQQIRENEIREIRSLQEYHMEQIKLLQNETDQLKEKEKQIKANLNAVEKELELLQESYDVLSVAADYGDAYNFNKIKMFTRKRSEEFRNEIKICISIVERTLDFAENSHELNNFKSHLEQQLKKENGKLTQLEAMYESEAKQTIRRSEQTWQQELSERNEKLKQILMDEHLLIKVVLDEIMKKHEQLLKNRAKHLTFIENSSEKLKLLIQEGENSPRVQMIKNNDSPDGAKHVKFSSRQHTVNNIIHSQTEESPSYMTPLELDDIEREELATHHNCNESNDNNMSPRCFDANDCNDINQASNSFNNLSMYVWQPGHSHPSQRELESQKQDAQRNMQVVTSETEAERPRFGRRHVAWD